MLLTILHQNPELLNVHAYNYREGILSSMVVPQYCYTQEKAAGLLAECNEEADSIAENQKQQTKYLRQCDKGT